MIRTPIITALLAASLALFLRVASDAAPALTTEVLVVMTYVGMSAATLAILYGWYRLIAKKEWPPGRLLGAASALLIAMAFGFSLRHPAVSEAWFRHTALWMSVSIAFGLAARQLKDRKPGPFLREFAMAVLLMFLPPSLLYLLLVRVQEGFILMLTAFLAFLSAIYLASHGPDSSLKA
jgi:hypothetical protein